jgi:hypothetical protein
MTVATSASRTLLPSRCAGLGACAASPPPLSDIASPSSELLLLLSLSRSLSPPPSLCYCYCFCTVFFFLLFGARPPDRVNGSLVRLLFLSSVSVALLAAFLAVIPRTRAHSP